MKKIAFCILSLLFILSACRSNEETPEPSSRNYQTESATSESSSEESLITEPSSTESNLASSQPLRVYSEREKQEINQIFLEWAGGRGEIGGMAVSRRFFDHGASGMGDWYAVTEDGLMQLQQQHPEGRPGYDAFSIHCIGGVVFYYSVFGTTGATEEVSDPQNSPSTATGFTTVADSERPFVKYLLGDNGVVYEAETLPAFSDGFYVADDYGDLYSYYDPANQTEFKISADVAAQQELGRILNSYN